MTQPPAWTPQPPPPFAAPLRKPVPIGGILGLAGAMILGISLFLPWTELSFDFGELDLEDFGIDPEISISGISQWQGLVAGAAALAAIPLGILALVLGTRKGRGGVGIGLLVAGALALVIALTRIGDAAWGLFVAFFGAVAILAGGVLALLESRRLGDAPAPGYTPAAPPPQPYS